MITTYPMFDNIDYFQIQDLNPCFSDYCALGYSVTTNALNLTNRSTSKMDDTPKKYFWNENIKQAFIANLNSPITQQLFAEVNSKILETSNKESCTSNTQLITNLLISAVKQSGAKTKGTSRNRFPRHKAWFDSDCNVKKTQILNLGKSVSREPKNSSLRTMLYDKKRTFKNLIRHKKLTYRNELIRKMEASDNDPKLFWHLLEDL